MLLAHRSGDGALLKVPQAQPLWRGSCDHSIPVLAPSMLPHKVGPSFFSLKGRGGTWRPCPSLTRDWERCLWFSGSNPSPEDPLPHPWWDQGWANPVLLTLTHL